MEYTGFGFSGYDQDSVGTSVQFNESFAFDNNVHSNNRRGSAFHNITSSSGNLDLIDEHHDEDTEPEEAGDHGKRFLHGILKRSGTDMLFNETQIVEETLDQHKYSQLANASYNYFNSKGSVDAVHEGLMNEDYNYIEDLRDFKMDTELSTIDNVVLHNAVTGETHVSFRGTTDQLGRTNTFLNDWRINAQTATGKIGTTRMNAASRQMEEVIAKYGKEELTLSGHSAGGGISFHQSLIHDVKSHNFNPAVNSTMVKQSPRYAENVAEKVIYKTPLDFASPLSYHSSLAKSNTKLTVVNNLQNMDGVVETHSIDQFAPKPSSVEGSIVTAERRSLAGSLFKGVGAIAGAALTAYSLEQDIEGDVKGDKSASEITADVSIDAAKQGEMLVVDGEIMGAALAAAPETMGLSLLAGAAGVVLNDFVAGHLADEAKAEVPKIGHALKKAGSKVKKFFSKMF